MDLNKQKELFNIAYICALAAQAGVNYGTPIVDDDSIDLCLMGKNYIGPRRNPQIQVQLKCTSQNFKHGDVLKFPLSRKNYDDLRGTNVICPRYLIVLVVPRDHNNWIQHDENCMTLSHACYWASIKDHPETVNGTITVDVPLNQKLTAPKLRELMLLASQGKSA